MRLKTHVAAGALLRRAQGRALFAAVLHKGHPDAGMLYVKLLCGRQAALYLQDHEGRWQPRSDGFVAEEEVDRAVARELKFDRDLWVIEIEGEEGLTLLGAD